MRGRLATLLVPSRQRGGVCIRSLLDWLQPAKDALGLIQCILCPITPRASWLSPGH